MGVKIILQLDAHKHMRMLQTVPLLQNLSSDELSEIVDTLEICRYTTGQDVITEGEVSQDMFVVESGTAVCTKIGGSSARFFLLRFPCVFLRVFVCAS
jgi:signal-transduction protein with cAMP-binding, CBS, and nucleotidyltransferase domain